MRIKKLFALMFLPTMVVSNASWSNTSGFFHGPSMTTGASSNKFTLVSSHFNPAVGDLLIGQEERIRTGYFSSLGFNNELGDVQNFEDDVNDLIDTLEAEDVTLDSATTTLDRFNAILPTLGAEGYIKLQGGASLPMFPIAVKIPRLKGSMVFDAGSDLLVRGSVLDDDLLLNPVSQTFQTNTALYLKSGTLMRAGAAYSRSIWSYSDDRISGQLYWGSRFNFYSMSLSKQVIGLDALEGDDIGDVIQDDYDTNEVSSTSFGLDQGLLWVADRYQLGMTIKNINEPEFEFGDLGQNCSSVSNAESQSNCFVAQYHSQSLGNLDLTESHIMHAFTTLDANVSILPRWSASFSYDISEYEDFVGDDLKMMSFSSEIRPYSIWFPSVRVGYQVNQVGSELSTLSFGTTLFGVANLDLAYGLESTEVDGSSAPRKFGLSFGFEERF